MEGSKLTDEALQREYSLKTGNIAYKIVGSSVYYTPEYVEWLEDMVLAFRPQPIKKAF